MVNTREELHTLYRFYDDAGGLLYVGITCSPSRRFGQHRREKSWWSDVAQIHLEQFETRADLMEAERAAIETEKPLLNRVSGASYINRAKHEPCPFTREETKSMVGKPFFDYQSGMAGRVIGRAGGGKMWLSVEVIAPGGSTGRRLMDLLLMKDFVFYESEDVWRSAVYERYAYLRPAEGAVV